MTSHVKGLHVRTKFLPVPDNRTEVLAHLAVYGISCLFLELLWICNGVLE